MPKRPLVAIVDDDKSIRETTKDLLESAGLAVVTFANTSLLLKFRRIKSISCHDEHGTRSVQDPMGRRPGVLTRCGHRTDENSLRHASTRNLTWLAEGWDRAWA